MEFIEQKAEQFFSIPSLKPYQKLVITTVLEHDRAQTERNGILTILPTGMGKSLCFLLPALLCEHPSLVIYPLLSLMRDQIAQLEKNSIPYAIIRGGQTKEEKQNQIDRILRGEAKILITNAESLQNPFVSNALKRCTLSLAVVDEAHTTIQWRDFRPAYRKLGMLLHGMDIRQIIAFTATAGETMTDRIVSSLFLGRKPLIVRASSDRSSIIYHREFTLSKLRTIHSFLKNGSLRPALVFAATRKQSEKIAGKLENPLYPVRYYHAGLAADIRKERERWFIDSSHGVLCCTNAFGMGVDKPDIRSVFHLFCPHSIEAYLQQSGRAARDGKKAHAFMLLNHRSSGPIAEAFTRTGCIREHLMTLMQESCNECWGCDGCSRIHFAADGLKQILRFALFHPLQYTAGQFCQIVGDTLLRDWRPEEIQEAVSNLLECGLLKDMRKRIYRLPGKQDDSILGKYGYYKRDKREKTSPSL